MILSGISSAGCACLALVSPSCKAFVYVCIYIYKYKTSVNYRLPRTWPLSDRSQSPSCAYAYACVLVCLSRAPLVYSPSVNELSVHFLFEVCVFVPCKLYYKPSVNEHCEFAFRFLNRQRPTRCDLIQAGPEMPSGGPCTTHAHPRGGPCVLDSPNETLLQPVAIDRGHIHAPFTLRNACVTFAAPTSREAHYRATFTSLDGFQAIIHDFYEPAEGIRRLTGVRAIHESEIPAFTRRCTRSGLGVALPLASNHFGHQLWHTPKAWHALHERVSPGATYFPIVGGNAERGARRWFRNESRGEGRRAFVSHAWELAVRAFTLDSGDKIAVDLAALLTAPCACFDRIEGAVGVSPPYAKLEPYVSRGRRYIYVCIYLYMYIYVCVYINFYIYICVCIYIYIYMYIHVYICTCMYIYKRIYMYIYQRTR